MTTTLEFMVPLPSPLVGGKNRGNWAAIMEAIEGFRAEVTVTALDIGGDAFFHDPKIHLEWRVLPAGMPGVPTPVDYRDLAVPERFSRYVRQGLRDAGVIDSPRCAVTEEVIEVDRGEQGLLIVVKER